MARTVQVYVGNIGGTILQQALPGVLTPADGIITVDSALVPQLLAAGGQLIYKRSSRQLFGTAPRLGTVGRIVASAALSNGTLTIANQPDVPRVLAMRVDPGTSAITAGVLTAIYVANDGTTQTDALSLVTAASTVFTTNLSKGSVQLNSVIVTALAGGASPLREVTDTNALAIQVDPGFVDFSVVAEQDDTTVSTAIGTVSSSAAAITPTGAPNGTHTYTFTSMWNAPTV